MSTLFRRPEPGDATAISDLYLASRKTFLPYAPLAHSDDDVRQWIADVLIPSGGVTVAEISGKLLGIMALRREGSIGWIDQLYLHPSAVGRGLGSQLLARARQELASPIRLYTFEANTSSRRFYERHGFRAIAFNDGRNNEENCPDVLYEFDPGAAPRPK